MTDPFASVVGPIFEYVIDLEQRLEERENPPLEAERRQIVNLLADADQKAGASGPLVHDYELARHGLVYWIDEVLINSTWKSAMEWRQQILEWELYGERLRADRFYEKAHDAEALASTDALEVFYLCVALGFRGRHVDAPAELRKWTERIYNRIAAGSQQADKFLPDDATEYEPLRPLPGPSILLAVSVLVSITALFTLVCFVLAVPPWE
jgi:type VI secretion system protein ImpK